MRLFHSLQHRAFAFLWSGQTISRLGDQIYRIALAWWVLEKTRSATAMGIVLIFSSVPSLLFALLGGVAVDRFPRARVMLSSDVLRGIVVAVVTLLAFTNLLEIWHLYVASMVFGSVDAFFQPAYVALVPEITPSEVLPSANSLTSVSGEVSGIVGPSLGAFMVAAGGTAVAFGLDALSFFISALCLIPLIHLPSPRANNSSSRGVLHEVREGFKTVLAFPWLWITIALAGVANFTISGPLSVATPFLIKNNLHQDVGALGLLFSLSSLGSLAAAVWLGQKRRLRRKGLTTYVAWIVGALMLVVYGLSVFISAAPVAALGVVALAALIFGGALASINLIWANTVQELVPREQMGRVASIDWLGSFALNPIGFGAPAVFVVGGAISVIMALPGLSHPAIRNLD